MCQIPYCLWKWNVNKTVKLADDNFWSLTELCVAIVNVTLHGLRRFLHFCNGHNYDKSFSVNKIDFSSTPIPKSECCKRGQKLGNDDDDFASYIDLPDVQRVPITAKEENGSIIIIGNNQRNSHSLLNWQHVKEAGSDTCPLSFILQNST